MNLLSGFLADLLALLFVDWVTERLGRRRRAARQRREAERRCTPPRP